MNNFLHWLLQRTIKRIRMFPHTKMTFFSAVRNLNPEEFIRKEIRRDNERKIGDVKRLLR